MQTTLTLAALASAALAFPHITRNTPAGCSTSYNGDFQITILNGSSIISKRDLGQRAPSTCGKEGYLTATLKDGNLVDNKGRIGSIVANRQFQFDGPPAQAGAVYSNGWSVCSNGSLATSAGSTLFYSCKSGEFANLYDQSIAKYCLPVYIDIIPCSSGSSGAVSQKADGQPTAAASAGAVTQIADGQPQGKPTAPAVTQIGDGQLQGMPAVTQVADGQLQIPTGAPPAVTQIGDGQLQAPATAKKPAATQIPDGQIQVAPTAKKPAATQIPDGQIQVAPTAKKPAATQIPDGQVQVPTAAKGPAVSQIPDGQLQSNVSTTAKPKPIAVSAGSTTSPLLVGTLASAVLGFAAVLLL